MILELQGTLSNFLKGIAFPTAWRHVNDLAAVSVREEEEEDEAEKVTFFSFFKIHPMPGSLVNG